MSAGKVWVMVVAAAMTLVACDKTDPRTDAGAGAGESAGVETVDAEQRSVEKVNAYTKGYNDMAGMFYGSTKGLDGLLEDYKAQDIAGMTSANADTRLVVYLNTSMLRNSLGNLKKGLALSGGADTAKVDQVVEKMVANGEVLFKQATDLDGYIDSKKYLEDNLAKAKAMDAEFTRRWAQLDGDFDALSDELDAIERANRTKVLARLQADGQTTWVDIKKGTYAANDLLALFDKASDFEDAGKMKQADALAKQVEDSATRIKAQLDAKTDGEQHGEEMGAYDDMMSLLGAYRQIKAGGDTGQFDEMVRQYNELIDRDRS